MSWPTGPSRGAGFKIPYRGGYEHVELDAPGDATPVPFRRAMRTRIAE